MTTFVARKGQIHMPLIIQHRRINIITLYSDDDVSEHCRPGDIAIKQEDDGWWTLFIGEDGQIDRYDVPFDDYNKALWSAKAAAEFSAE